MPVKSLSVGSVEQRISDSTVAERVSLASSIEREILSATIFCVIAAWQQARNAQTAKINWRFTTEDARIKLKRLYPSHEL